MSEPAPQSKINLAELRADVVDFSEIAGTTSEREYAMQVLALLDAVEAAHAQVYPGGHLDPSWYGSTLKRALDAFDHEPTP